MVAGIEAVVPLLPDGGRIVSISSGVAARAGFQGMAYYAGTRSALEGFSRGAARDFLAGPQASYVTGAVLRIDGGYGA